jgi:hypothetical protein
MFPDSGKLPVTALLFGARSDQQRGVAEALIGGAASSCFEKHATV